MAFSVAEAFVIAEPGFTPGEVLGEEKAGARTQIR